MILAEWAGQITAETAHRQNLTARMEAAQGLLFDGVKHQCCEFPVVCADDCSVFVFSCPAAAVLSFCQRTVMGTDPTGDVIFFSLLHQKCLTTSKRSS